MKQTRCRRKDLLPATRYNNCGSSAVVCVGYSCRLGSNSIFKSAPMKSNIDAGTPCSRFQSENSN